MSADNPMGPAVQQAHRALSEAIRQGRYARASRLPGERDLALELGVSRGTIRHVLQRLAVDGLVRPAPQRGWFVADTVLGEPPSVLMSFTDMARARGLEPRTRVLRQRVRGASFDEAERLGIAPSATVLELVRLRSLDRLAVCIDTNVLCRGVEELAVANLTDRSLYRSLEERCGIRVARCSYTVQAVAADEKHADRLGLEAGAPLLFGQEIGYCSRGLPVACGTTYYRGDAYRFQADLFAPSG